MYVNRKSCGLWFQLNYVKQLHHLQTYAAKTKVQTSVYVFLMVNKMSIRCNISHTADESRKMSYAKVIKDKNDATGRHIFQF